MEATRENGMFKTLVIENWGYTHQPVASQQMHWPPIIARSSDRLAERDRTVYSKIPEVFYRLDREEIKLVPTILRKGALCLIQDDKGGSPFNVAERKSNQHDTIVPLGAAFHMLHVGFLQIRRVISNSARIRRLRPRARCRFTWLA